MPKPKLTKQRRERMIKEFGHIPTKEELFAKIQASQQNLLNALAGAWDNAPDDPKIRSELLNAMKKAINLRDKTAEVFAEKEKNK